jgi:hypothetical protein
MLQPAPTQFPECAKRAKRLADLPTLRRTEWLSLLGKEERNPLKLKERSGNVYENKGPLWESPERSWNLFENKGR